MRIWRPRSLTTISSAVRSSIGVTPAILRQDRHLHQPDFDSFLCVGRGGLCGRRNGGEGKSAEPCDGDKTFHVPIRPLLETQPQGDREVIGCLLLVDYQVGSSVQPGNGSTSSRYPVNSSSSRTTR